MPLVYTTDSQRTQGTLVYPDQEERLIVEHGVHIVMSCISSNFTLGIINSTNEIVGTCVGGNRIRYEKNIYYYFEFECQYVPRSTMIITNRVCQPNNNTLIRIGFQTRNLFFPLYDVCYDLINKNSLYTWFKLRIPYYDHYQHRPRMRFFYRDEAVFEDILIDGAYSKFKQVSVRFYKTIRVVKRFNVLILYKKHKCI